MVGQVGTLPMSGVAVVGQLLFVYNLAIWGSTSGAGIFGAQFYGRGDMDGVRHTFRFKLLVSTAITAAAIMLFLAAGLFLVFIGVRCNAFWRGARRAQFERQEGFRRW